MTPEQTTLSKKYVALFVAVLVIIGVIGAVYWYLSSTFVVTINYQNVSSVTIKDYDTIDGGVGEKTIKQGVKNGEQVRLSKLDYGTAYAVTYEGNGDYASGQVGYVDEKTGTVSINPDYSEAWYSKKRDEVKPLVDKAILDKYPLASNYEIQPGMVYKKGEWYGTTLVWKGTPTQTSDTIRVILHHENDSWVVATEPNIILSKKLNPKVPFEILSAVNNKLD